MQVLPHPDVFGNLGTIHRYFFLYFQLSQRLKAHLLPSIICSKETVNNPTTSLFFEFRDCANSRKKLVEKSQPSGKAFSNTIWACRYH